MKLNPAVIVGLGVGLMALGGMIIYVSQFSAADNRTSQSCECHLKVKLCLERLGKAR